MTGHNFHFMKERKLAFELFVKMVMAHENGALPRNQLTIWADFKGELRDPSVFGPSVFVWVGFWHIFNDS